MQLRQPSKHAAVSQLSVEVTTLHKFEQHQVTTVGSLQTGHAHLPPAMFDQPYALDHPAVLYMSVALGYRLPPTVAAACSWCV